MIGFDPMYFLFVGPGMLLALFATIKVQTTFSKYSRTAAASGLTGAQAAKFMLERQGVFDVTIQEVEGFLSDHYDPTSRTLRLSPNVYHSQSLSAIGVACHEAGHALQHATHYAWLGWRSAMVPATSIGSYGSYILFILGMLFHSPTMILVGVGLFSLVVLFSVITLPVEWNASARAKALMVSTGIVSAEEQNDAAAVLNAAFLTYVASAVTSLLTLLYYLWRMGLLGGRRND
jgi:Zn-dependent membrane protease YugP